MAGSKRFATTRKKIEGASDKTIMILFLIVAAVAIIMAFAPINRWIKAAVLLYFILP